MEDTDDAEHTSESVFFKVMVVNVIFFIILLCIFEMARNIRSIYAPRFTKKYLESSRVPALPPSYPLGWVRAIQNVSDDELLHFIGLDGYMLIRFIYMCFRISVFLQFVGCSSFDSCL